MKTKIFVVGFEGNSNFGISFWDWYSQESDAISRKVEIKNAEDLKNNGAVYSGSLLIDGTEDIEDINNLVELYLEENNWENAFKKQAYYGNFKKTT